MIFSNSLNKKAKEQALQLEFPNNDQSCHLSIILCCPSANTLPKPRWKNCRREQKITSQKHLSASQFWSKTVNVNPSLEIYWHRRSFVLLTGFFQYMHSKAYESKRPLRLRRRGMSWLMDVGMQGEYKCWPLIPASPGRHRTFPFMTGSLQWFFCCLERLLTEPHRLSWGTGH